MRQISQPQHVMVLPITNIDQYWVLVNIDRRDDVNIPITCVRNGIL